MLAHYFRKQQEEQVRVAPAAAWRGAAAGQAWLSAFVMQRGCLVDSQDAAWRAEDVAGGRRRGRLRSGVVGPEGAAAGAAGDEAHSEPVISDLCSGSLQLQILLLTHFNVASCGRPADMCTLARRSTTM